MPVLADLGYRVWAPNLRGYGRSSRPPRVRDYAIEHLLDDVSGLIEAGGATDEVVLLGHDWGAVIAWAYAIAREQEDSRLAAIDRLVIMNVPHPAPFARELKRFGRQMRRSWYVFFFQVPAIAEWFLSRMDVERVAGLFRDNRRRPVAIQRRRHPHLPRKPDAAGRGAGDGELLPGGISAEWERSRATRR